MKRMRSREDNCYDIDKENVFSNALLVMIVVAIICVAVLGLYALITAMNNSCIPDYNETATAFNNLPFADRKVIAEWTEDDKIDPETFLIPMEEPGPLFLLSEIHGRGNVVKALPYYLAALAIIFSLAVFGFYWYSKDSEYYLCALPFDKPYGWLLFFSMFVGWPILFVSFVIMRVQNSDYLKQQRDKRRKAKKRERAEVKRLAEEELEEAAKRLTKPAFSEPAHQAFKSYVEKGYEKAQAARKKEAKEKIAEAKASLRVAGEQVQKAQQELGKAQADLKNLEKAIAKPQKHQLAEADWQAIKDTRGISRIIYNKTKQRLEITIKVRVPYEGELYDFGDYRFYIDGSGRDKCKEIRSGVKFNATSHDPYYRNSDGTFCFGHNASTIRVYLDDERYVEAITLVVECLHSVNSEHAARQIPNCFRKVKTIEREKRFISLRNKFKLRKGA